jgi:hypothetical protein
MSDAMNSDELTFLAAVGYGGIPLSALPQAQDCADAVTLPGAWVKSATRALGDPVQWLWRNVSAVKKITVAAGAVGVGKSLLAIGDRRTDREGDIADFSPAVGLDPSRRSLRTTQGRKDLDLTGDAEADDADDIGDE